MSDCLQVIVVILVRILADVLHVFYSNYSQTRVIFTDRVFKLRFWDLTYRSTPMPTCLAAVPVSELHVWHAVVNAIAEALTPCPATCLH